MSALETSPGPINPPPPPPPAIGARFFPRPCDDCGKVCWAPAESPHTRDMLVEASLALNHHSWEATCWVLTQLLGDLQRITLQSGNPLEALAPAGWVYVGQIMGSKGLVQLFGRGEDGVLGAATMLAEVMAAGNHPPAPGEQGPVPPIVEVPVELPWLDHEDPPEVALPSMTQPAPSASDVPTVKLPAPSRAEELIAKALASIKYTTVCVDDAGFTVIWGERDLINPADKHSSDWLTDLLTYLEPTPASVREILKLVDSFICVWTPPGQDGRDDGVLDLGHVKLYIGPEFAEFGGALCELSRLAFAGDKADTDDRGPVAPRADDAGLLVEADPVEVCAELLAEMLDEAHYGANSVQVSEHEDESVVVIGSVTFRISAPNFYGRSARVARALGALGDALKSRFVARFGETASEE